MEGDIDPYNDQPSKFKPIKVLGETICKKVMNCESHITNIGLFCPRMKILPLKITDFQS